uniref:Battenin n=1 Tax=Steinernema glaseri TaxID=37863 RepID=A0A1I8A607_9BILA
MKRRTWTTLRNLAAFWLFGLCNNYAYVIMLSAAEDIMDKQEHKFSNDTDVDTCEVSPDWKTLIFWPLLSIGNQSIS